MVELDSLLWHHQMKILVLLKVLFWDPCCSWFILMAHLGFSYQVSSLLSLMVTSCFIEWSLALKKTLVKFRVTLMICVTGYLSINWPWSQQMQVPIHLQEKTPSCPIPRCPDLLWANLIKDVSWKVRKQIGLLYWLFTSTLNQTHWKLSTLPHLEYVAHVWDHICKILIWWSLSTGLLHLY